MAAQQNTSSSLIALHRSPLTPNLAAAAKRFGLHPDAVKRHEDFMAQRQQDLHILQQERDASREKYAALKQTVDLLVHHIKDVASDPTQAHSKDIHNIRQLLKQALTAMERQQAELKGIRARTQRMERAALKADTAQNDVKALHQEISGYQQALHGIRADMAALVEVVEGEGGLKELQGQIQEVRGDLTHTQERTTALEETSTTQTARIEQLESEVQHLRRMMATSLQETSGLTRSVIGLRNDVSQLRKKIGHYLIDQMRAARHR